jgi:hypothetical protein
MTYECWSLLNVPDPVADRIEGYYDGFDGEPAPGPNRSAAYHHGWWCGASDKGHVEMPAWLHELARQQINGAAASA